jgi:hypothetical protein
MLRRVVLASGLIVIGVVAWNGVVRHTSLGHPLIGSSSCIVGEPGTAAKMEIVGPTATDSCQLEVSKDGFYAYQGPVNETVVCQYEWRSDQWTVYDEGLMNLVGGELCSHLKKKLGT